MSICLDQITAKLKSDGESASRLEALLPVLLAALDSETVTVHRLSASDQTLRLVAQIGLPPTLLETVRAIPVGKGIAGETVVRNEPVTICNLQTDVSGIARPGAKQSGVGGAVSVPIRSAGVIVGTLGIGTKRQHEYSPEEIAKLESIASLLGERGLI